MGVGEAMGRAVVELLRSEVVVRLKFLLFVVLAGAIRVDAADQGGTAGAPATPPPVEGVLRTYCYACHGEKKSKGHVRLDTLSTLNRPVRSIGTGPIGSAG